VPPDEFAAVLGVNLTGAYRVAREAAKRLVAAGKPGSVVNVASISGLIGVANQSVYAMTKGAIVQLTRQLANEYAARGVRVNAVAPTYIETPMVRSVPGVEAMMKEWLRDTPMNRLGQPHEIASVVHFLASDAASLMTGATVQADGGFTCW
jgi:NAD(P)-dependent dehydrogenase (short-subunit alcohol dehydrogenase family)